MEELAKSNCNLRGIFASAFSNWRKKNNIPLKKIAMELNVSISTVQTWASGKRFPSGNHFELLVDYTGIPPCRLLCIMGDTCISSQCPIKEKQLASEESNQILLKVENEVSTSQSNKADMQRESQVHSN